MEEEKCSCENDAQSLHTCPYAEDVNNDSVALCNCCAECIKECLNDI